ncbi:uncharacterized protein LOC141757668 isoform X2 [Sebastes fasciatus]|uniref:uncharacterized protein LOC141757668 isoform X2 n=1 Tax=Sebastes fasciatus TaxID=394691 RepID=UPI003D9DC27E
MVSSPQWLVVISVRMPGMCSVPGCKGYRKARSRGVVFHSLPTRDPQRCRLWLKAIHSPKFNEHTPVGKYGNIIVCSQHFKPDDYEPDIQAELMKTTPRKILKSNVIPTVFSGGQQEDLSGGQPEDLSSSLPAEDSSRTEVTSTSSQAPSLSVQGNGVDTASPSPSLPSPVTSVAPSTSPQPPAPAERSEGLCSVASVDRLSESFQQETESSSTATSKSDENADKDSSQSKTIVNDSCLMELFKKCQTCGRPITKKTVSHCGAQKKVRWSCLGGHRGIWMSSPHLWEAFPEIHLLTTLSVLFSGGTFTHFKKWAKHLHLNFMGHKTFFEIQKAYLNPEIKPMNRIEQEGIFAKGFHQQPEGALLHFSDPLKKIKSKSRRREKGALSSSYEKRSSILMTSTGTCMHEPTALSSLWRLSASESYEKRSSMLMTSTGTCMHESTALLSLWRLSASESYEKRSSILMTSAGTCMHDPTALLSLWRLSASESGRRHQQDDDEHQSETTEVASEVEWLQDSFEEMEVTIDDDDCNSVKNRLSDLDSDMENLVETTEQSAPAADNSCDEDIYVPTIHQRSTTSEFLLECEEEELEPWQKHTLRVRLKEEDDVGEWSDDQTDCKPDPSTLQSWLAGQHTPTPEACGVVHTSEVHQISNNSASLSSVHSPEVYTTSSIQLQSNQSSSQTLFVPFSLPCFTVLKLESSGTSDKQRIINLKWQ